MNRLKADLTSRWKMVAKIKEMLRKGIWMADYYGGSPRWALTLQQTFEIIDALETDGIPILGGDAYKFSDGYFKPTYMNWYSDQKLGETSAEFAIRSASESRDYLRRLNIIDQSLYIDIVIKGTSGEFRGR